MLGGERERFGKERKLLSLPKAWEEKAHLNRSYKAVGRVVCESKPLFKALLSLPIVPHALSDHPHGAPHAECLQLPNSCIRKAGARQINVDMRQQLMRRVLTNGY